MIYRFIIIIFLIIVLNVQYQVKAQDVGIYKGIYSSDIVLMDKDQIYKNCDFVNLDMGKNDIFILTPIKVDLGYTFLPYGYYRVIDLQQSEVKSSIPIFKTSGKICLLLKPASVFAETFEWFMPTKADKLNTAWNLMRSSELTDIPLSVVETLSGYTLNFVNSDDQQTSTDERSYPAFSSPDLNVRLDLTKMSYLDWGISAAVTTGTAVVMIYTGTVVIPVVVMSSSKMVLKKFWSEIENSLFKILQKYEGYFVSYIVPPNAQSLDSATTYATEKTHHANPPIIHSQAELLHELFATKFRVAVKTSENTLNELMDTLENLASSSNDAKLMYLSIITSDSVRVLAKKLQEIKMINNEIFIQQINKLDSEKIKFLTGKIIKYIDILERHRDAISEVLKSLDTIDSESFQKQIYAIAGELSFKQDAIDKIRTIFNPTTNPNVLSKISLLKEKAKNGLSANKEASLKYLSNFISSLSEYSIQRDFEPIIKIFRELNFRNVLRTRYADIDNLCTKLPSKDPFVGCLAGIIEQIVSVDRHKVKVNIPVKKEQNRGLITDWDLIIDECLSVQVKSGTDGGIIKQMSKKVEGHLVKLDGHYYQYKKEPLVLGFGPNFEDKLINNSIIFAALDGLIASIGTATKAAITSMSNCLVPYVAPLLITP